MKAPAAAPQQQQQDPVTQRMQALLDGKEEAPSELCAYLVQAIKESAEEREDLTKRIQEAEQFLARFRARQAALDGILQKASADLRKALSGGKPVLLPVAQPEPECQQCSNPAEIKEAQP